MATEILRPRDCLIRVHPASISRRRSYIDVNHCNYYHSNHRHHQHDVSSSRSSRKPVTRPDQRKRVAVGGSNQPAVAVVEAFPVLRRTPTVDDSRINTRSSGYAMEKVTILRRGQSLDPPSSLSAMRSDVYAGSAFAMSPAPSALPIPSFPTKQQQASPAAVDDSATRDLRRLLRLE